MRISNKRICTRSQAWPDTQANVTVLDKNRRGNVVKGRVRDIGACGMFLETPEYVPLNENIRIEIQFDPKSSFSKLPLHVTGKTVHSTSVGVGIRFTEIDLSLLQRRIIEKMNRLDRQKAEIYTIGSNGEAESGA
ncbi:MAG TPA: PilZ domain-containing protein [Desulfosalsimonadaceae bacterium]|nr:PilZ domain-containing protein [Desulfosalsimonadaceae bacterium]